MEQLLVRLGARFEDPVQWLVYTDGGQEVIASGELPEAGALDTLTERAGDRPVIALAPASEILLTWVTLPARANRKVLSAIPYMLEDELASDIHQQFFALGPRLGERQAVAVVSRAQLDSWQQWMQQAGLYCDTLIPDVLAVPPCADGWSVLSIGGDLLLREEQWKGLQGEQSWILPAFAHLARQQSSPVRLVSYSDIALTDMVNVQVEQAPLELPMQVLASHVAHSKVNLLQGEYKVKRQRTGQWQQWKWVAGLAALALSVTLVERGMTLSQVEQQNRALASQIDTAVKNGFPDLGVYRDVRRKITSQMALLKQSGGDASMLVMLSQLSPAFAATQVRPQTLRFDANRVELRIQAMGKNFEALEQFRREAQSAGFTVEQGAINNRDDMVIGNVTIRSQS
ncbi:type II secretion system protein GspL [Salinimonas sediminis]|uniref:Type II secretion system protein L n=1 Tax=Salinimonas sediminis TaxID=2303538 RepID=A0A346NHK4_9ALTE|nr:type II secretion system protein GspL [Salinimonas sediminis]AXR05011.1 type II secretion system protein GspL [Salinimonas sediminis]